MRAKQSSVLAHVAESGSPCAAWDVAIHSLAAASIPFPKSLRLRIQRTRIKMPANRAARSLRGDRTQERDVPRVPDPARRNSLSRGAHRLVVSHQIKTATAAGATSRRGRCTAGEFTIIRRANIFLAQAPTQKNSAPPPIGSEITGISATPSAATPPHAATAERTITVESGLYHVELSNKGAVVRSWVLQQYTDESTPPKKLDIVHPDVATQFGGWPLSVVMDDPQLESRANAALYEVSGASTSGALQAPAEVDFTWSDGHLSVTKKIKFDSSYIAEIHP